MNSFTEIAKEKSTAELIEIIYALDDWDPNMRKECENELTRRKQLPADFESKMKELIEQGEAKLAMGKPASMLGIIVGWLTIFGLLGLYIGYHYSYSKITSRNTGIKYYEYNQESRKNGEYILYASVLGCLASVIYFIIVFRGYGV